MGMSTVVDRAFDDLARGASAGRLAHGYIVAGPVRGEAARLADKILTYLFCPQTERPCGECPSCRQVLEQRHPDVAWLEPQGKSRTLSVDQIRRLNIRLARTSFGGGWKAAVLIHADRMTQSAANAFLKTLEEPSSGCLLLLLSEHPSLLLPTIRSRCQRVALNQGARRPDGDWMPELLDLLRSGPPADTLEALAKAAAADRLLRAVTQRVKENEEPGPAAEDGVDADVMESRIRSRVGEVREDIMKAVQCWQRDILCLASGAGNPALFFPEEQERLRQLAASHSWSSALTALQAVEEAARKLDQNLPALVVFETLFVEQGRAAQRRTASPSGASVRMNE